MKQFYSTLTKKVYDTEEEFEEAELAFEKKEEEKRIAKETANAERKEMAKAVEDAWNEYREAKKKLNDLLSKFCEKYGYYHTSVTTDSCRDLFNSVWADWFGLF